MIGDKSNFLPLKAKEGGFVTFGDNNKGRILRYLFMMMMM